MPGWQFPVSSSLHHLPQTEMHAKHWYTTALLLSPGCGKEIRSYQKTKESKPTRTKARLLDTYNVCNAAEHPRAYFGIPSRAVAASLTQRGEQKLAGRQTQLLFRPPSSVNTFNNHFSSLTSGLLQERKAALLIPRLRFPEADWGLNNYTGFKDCQSPCW